MLRPNKVFVRNEFKNDMLAAVFSYYVPQSKLNLIFGPKCIIVNKNDLEIDFPSLEFTAYESLLNKISDKKQSDQKLFFIANDTFITKNYKNLFIDITTKFRYISAFESPYMVSSMDYSMVRLPGQKETRNFHACSQFYLMNWPCVEVLRRAIIYAKYKPINLDVSYYAALIYPEDAKRKAYAINMELYISQYLQTYAQILDINASRSIMLKRVLYSLKCSIF